MKVVTGTGIRLSKAGAAGVLASAAFTQTPTMKTPSLLFIAFTLATPAFSQDAPATGGPEGSLKAKAAARLELLLETPGPRLLEKFDANKDGTPDLSQ